MSDVTAAVRAMLAASGLDHDIIACDPRHADTAVFCAEHGYPLDDSANAIVIRGKTGERRMAMCVLLATCKLDVGASLRERIGSRRVSFASAEETVAATGMQLGGVTPLGLAADMPVWVDGAVMQRERIILGGGDRTSKVIIAPAIFAHLAQAEVIDGLAKPRD